MFGLYDEIEETGDPIEVNPWLDPFSDHDLSVQCITGHVFTAQPGTDLGRMLIARESKGLDPLSVQSHECPKCIEEEEAS